MAIVSLSAVVGGSIMGVGAWEVSWSVDVA